MTNDRSRIGPCLASAVLLATINLAAGEAAASCADAAPLFITDVSRIFSSGSRWTFSIYRTPCEGLVIQNAKYAPAHRLSRLVLNRASIAEIHVPYATGTPRNFEVTSTNEGLGDTNPAGKSYAVPLNATECPGPGPNQSTLYDGNRICVMNEDGEYRFKVDDQYLVAERVAVFMSTQVEKENYINLWEFNDDGKIEVSLGITGRVPVIKTSTSYAAYGARLEKAGTTPQIALAHHHNVYYRLDFDIDGPDNDQLWQKTFAGTSSGPAGSDCSITGQCGAVSISQVKTEAAKTWSSTAQTTWIVTDAVTRNDDGRNLGYELIPDLRGLWHGMTSSSEPWAGSEVWVTRFNDCELFAAKNVTPALPTRCGSGNKSHVSAMVDGQSVDRQNLVVWYANRMFHDHRDEDQSNMPIQWMGFEIAPRSFHHENPLLTCATCPAVPCGADPCPPQ